MQDNTCVCCGRIIPEGRHICLSCGSYDDMQTFRPSSRAYYPEPPKVTNADRIRQMTDEELREFLNDIADKCSMQDCKYCPMNGACDDVPISMQKWLKQEVSNDDR